MDTIFLLFANHFQSQMFANCSVDTIKDFNICKLTLIFNMDSFIICHVDTFIICQIYFANLILIFTKLIKYLQIVVLNVTKDSNAASGLIKSFIKLIKIFTNCKCGIKIPTNLISQSSDMNIFIIYQ